MQQPGVLGEFASSRSSTNGESIVSSGRSVPAGYGRIHLQQTARGLSLVSSSDLAPLGVLCADTPKLGEQGRRGDRSRRGGADCCEPAGERCRRLRQLPMQQPQGCASLQVGIPIRARREDCVRLVGIESSTGDALRWAMLKDLERLGPVATSREPCPCQSEHNRRIGAKEDVGVARRPRRRPSSATCVPGVEGFMPGEDGSTPPLPSHLASLKHAQARGRGAHTELGDRAKNRRHLGWRIESDEANRALRHLRVRPIAARTCDGAGERWTCAARRKLEPGQPAMRASAGTLDGDVGGGREPMIDVAVASTPPSRTVPARGDRVARPGESHRRVGLDLRNFVGRP